MTEHSAMSVLGGKTSFALNYPTEMKSALSEIVEVLNSVGYLVDLDPVTTVAEARTAVESSSSDTHTYYTVETTSSKVWDILKEPIEDGRIFVVGLFHGRIPDFLPSNMVVVDLGKSLRRKVSKGIVSTLTSSLTTKGKLPKGDPEQLYYGLKTLSYEVVYNAEKRAFPKSLERIVFVSTAFDFLFNSPSPLNQQTMRSAVNRFVRTTHGNLD